MRLYSVRLVREIHAELLRGVRGGKLQPGDLRRSQSWIGPASCTLNTATFVPPPHHSVPEALGELKKFLHRADDLPPLVKIALARVQFETIHPFLDGNGRVGRLLMVSCRDSVTFAFLARAHCAVARSVGRQT